MNEQFIGRVQHTKDNDFDFTKASVACTIGHPLGTVYQQGWWGYVANGYDWWKFPILELGRIIKYQ